MVKNLVKEKIYRLVSQIPKGRVATYIKDSGKGIVYTCPMHPEVQQEKPGMCPECGMALVPSQKDVADKQPESPDKHAEHSTQLPARRNLGAGGFFRKFWVSLILTLPIVAYSKLPELFFGWAAPIFPGSEYLNLILGSIVFFYGGGVFLLGAFREIKARLPGMMTLIALATSAAYLWSVYAVFFADEPLFWELATLITVMLLGHWLEMKAVQKARGALKELAKLLPDQAEVVRGNKTTIIPLSELEVNDVVLVKPGAKVPVDGKIIEGESELNESIVTGESKLVSKKAGDEVIAGTINGDGILKVKIDKIGEDTFLAGVMRLVAEAEASKSRLQILSDKAALFLTIIAVSAGAVTLGGWFLAGATVTFAVARLVAVLVIACPHALGLAVPLTASISTNMAASHGFIIKRRLALEAARNTDIVLFDKTGTLTKGEFGVTEVISTNKMSDKAVRILQLAASLDRYSEHSIAKAIVKEAQNKKLELLPVKDFRRIAGKGAKGEVLGKEVLVGSEILLKDREISLKKEFEEKIKEQEAQGKTVIYVILENQLLGAIALTDIIREESRLAIKMLHSQNKKVVMITGDSEDVAKWVASELRIDEYFARVLPEKKVEKVKELQNRGLKVAMVGDGVNDAPALTAADVGIAIGAGTNVAIESAGIILVRNDPRDIPKIIRLSRLTYQKMIQNLFWATGYNIVALPLAAGALAFRGILLEPALAALFMSLSTIIVAINAVLLRRKAL